LYRLSFFFLKGKTKLSYKIGFFRSGLLLTATALAMKTVGMFFGAYISRTVGAEGVGLYTLVMTVYSFAVTLATSGVSLTVTRLVASAIGEGKESHLMGILRGALLYSFAFGALSSVLLFFGAPIIGNVILADERTVGALRALSLSLVPISLGSCISGYFVGVKRVGFNAAVSVFGQCVKILVTVVLVTLAIPRGLVVTVIALCFGITLTEILAFALIWIEFLYDKHKNVNKHSQISGNDIKSVAQMAVPLALSAYVRSILLSVEHVLIPKRLRDRGESSGDAYAHYGALHGMAIPLVLYPMTPLSSFSGLLVPEFAEDMSGGKDERMSRIATKALNTTLSYSALAAVILYVFSPELGYLVYDSYDAGHYIAILAPVIPIMYLDHVTDYILKGIGEQVYSMWVNITDSVLSVILVWFLIPQLGITGYALVIIIMEGYNFILSFIRLKRKIRFDLSLVGSILLPLLCALISSFAAKELFLFSGKDVSALWLILEIVFAIAIFVAIRFLLYSLSKLIAKNRKVKAG